MFVKEAKATAKHILTATEEESKKVLEEIESGVKTFEDAAKEYSTCPSKAQGGSLGTFGRIMALVSATEMLKKQKQVIMQ